MYHVLYPGVGTKDVKAKRMPARVAQRVTHPCEDRVRLNFPLGHRVTSLWRIPRMYTIYGRAPFCDARIVRSHRTAAPVKHHGLNATKKMNFNDPEALNPKKASTNTAASGFEHVTCRTEMERCFRVFEFIDLYSDISTCQPIKKKYHKMIYVDEW